MSKCGYVDVELHWHGGARIVWWTVDGFRVTKEHDQPVNSAIVAGDPPSIVIVERPSEASAGQNAVVYEVDGRERVRLRPPRSVEAIGFDQVFVSRAGLVAVFATRTVDLQGEPDLQTGELLNVREWR